MMGGVGLLDGLGLVGDFLEGVVLALEGGAVLGPEGLDELEGFVEPFDALPEGGPLEAVGDVLGLGGAGAEAELGAAAADVVEGAHDLGRDDGMAEVVAHHEGGEA